MKKFKVIIKVITSLIRGCTAQKSRQLSAIKKQFLSDMIALCAHSRENRR
jgi:hypothetical protein